MGGPPTRSMMATRMAKAPAAAPAMAATRPMPNPCSVFSKDSNPRSPAAPTAWPDALGRNYRAYGKRRVSERGEGVRHGGRTINLGPARLRQPRRRGAPGDDERLRQGHGRP